MPVCLLFPLPNLQGWGGGNMPRRVREVEHALGVGAGWVRLG